MIYAIRAVGTEFIKLGKSFDPIKRLAELQTSNPHQLQLIACAEWPVAEEPLIHLYLAHCLARGEWFKNEPDTQKIVGLLRDGELGLREWQRIRTSGNSSPTRVRMRALVLHPAWKALVHG